MPLHRPQITNSDRAAALDRGRNAQRRTILPPHQGPQMPQLVTALHRHAHPKTAEDTDTVGAAA